VTEWVQFQALELDRLKKLKTQPVVVDLRNIDRSEGIDVAGFIYECVGRDTLN
jgi:UDPglucose 6-dehydrogenase